MQSLVSLWRSASVYLASVGAEPSGAAGAGGGASGGGTAGGGTRGEGTAGGSTLLGVGDPSSEESLCPTERGGLRRRGAIAYRGS